jgi:protein involved in polysaccharide export with SLBB domain
MNLRAWLLAAASAAAIATVPLPLLSQTPAPIDPGRIQVTRAELQDLLQQLEQAASSDVYSKPVRDRARAEAELIRGRLAQGDFQVGDRISLVVEGEQSLTDTFTVMPGRVLRLPAIGDVQLAGVLRSEIEAHLTKSIGEFIRGPVVRTRTLVRLSLLGELRSPGFYVVPTDMVLTDALMLAGGPTATAKLTNIRIERDGARVWEDDALQKAIAQGRTVDQLSLRAGDQVVVPRKGGGFGYGTLRTVSLLLSIPVAIYGLTQIF